MWKKRALVFDDEDIYEYSLPWRKAKGWMFWACFAGGTKGPGFIWEKRIGGIDRWKYIQYILPLVASFQQRLGRRIIFQQDNAPAHRAHATRDAFNAAGI
jgi:hypothetical protein